jgi:putative two-component system response regulator
MERLTILIVDDEPGNLAIMRAILNDHYHLLFARTGEEAEQAALRYRPAMVLLDIGLPDTDGIALCRRLKQGDPHDAMRIIFVTGYRDIEREEAGFEAGCVDYIVKPVSPSLVRARVAAHLALVRATALEESHRAAILMLGQAGHFNDNDTGTHIWRMAAYARQLASANGWDDTSARRLELAAPLHDTGKLGVPQSILQKPGPLNEEEWRIMRKHPEIGHAILCQSRAPVFQLAAEVALRHHEKWDGSGYPGRLCGYAIPESARLVALADVFDALSMRRCYKDPWPIDRINAYIVEQSGTHFDPALVQVYLATLPALLATRERWGVAEDKLDPAAAAHLFV